MIRPHILILVLVLANSAFAQDLGFKEATAKYGASVPLFAEILEGISNTESSLNPDVLPSKNERVSKTGEVHVSHDYTHMQINDYFWKETIGSDLWDAMLEDPKVATMIGAWILAQNFQKYDTYKDAIAAYNTGRAIDLDDCLKGTPSHRAGGPISPEDMAKAKARMERGRIYALKVYKYMVDQGYIDPSGSEVAEVKRQPKAPTSARIIRQKERQPINVASFRKHGGWRKVQ